MKWGHKREGCGSAGDRAHDTCGYGHAPEQFDVAPPQVSPGQAHVSGGLIRLGAVPDALYELYVWDAVLDRQWLGELARALADVVRAAAGDGEVVAAYGDRPAVYLRESHDVSAGGELDDVAVLVELGGAHHGACFQEAAGVDHLFDPLTDGVAASVVLALDPLRTAQLFGEAPNVLDVFDGFIPVIAGLPALTRQVYWHVSSLWGRPATRLRFASSLPHRALPQVRALWEA